MIRDELPGFAVGLCAGLVLAVVAFFWGQWVGARDEKLTSGADRHAAVNLCRQQDAVAILITGQHADADRWVCSGGSSRLLKRRAPLSSPVGATVGRP